MELLCNFLGHMLGYFRLGLKKNLPYGTSTHNMVIFRGIWSDFRLGPLWIERDLSQGSKFGWCQTDAGMLCYEEVWILAILSIFILKMGEVGQG
jgi:hypothetical protein